MEIHQTILRRLLPDHKELINASADEIMDHVGINRYRQENIQLKDEEVFFRLPALLQDIVLLIDFDTELIMNGILGFLETRLENISTRQSRRWNASERYMMRTL
ncbi:hypothetical protein ACJ7K1_11395 [Paenibacillus elgii]